MPDNPHAALAFYRLEKAEDCYLAAQKLLERDVCVSLFFSRSSLIVKNDIDEFGVVVFDLNDLKTVNDTKGHEAGDDYIRKAGQSAPRGLCGAEPEFSSATQDQKMRLY